MCMHMFTCHSTCMEIGDQLLGVSSLMLLRGSQESNSDSQVWQQPWSSFLIIKMKECILSHFKPSSSLVLCQYLSLGWGPDDHISSEISLSGDRWLYPNVNETMITMCLILNSCWILLLIMKTKLLFLQRSAIIERYFHRLRF